MKTTIKNSQSDNILKRLIISLIIFLFILNQAIELITNLTILSNFDAPYLFEYVYNFLIKLIIGGE